jgi:hypothetical protein
LLEQQLGQLKVTQRSLRAMPRLLAGFDTPFVVASRAFEISQ